MSFGSAEETTQKEALHQDKNITQHPNLQRRLQTLLQLLGKTFHGCSLNKTSPDYSKRQTCQVLRLQSCTQQWCKKGTTSGCTCFLLNSAQCLTRLHHTTQGLIPHTKVSSHSPTTALSAGDVWLKLLFLSWSTIKTKSFEEWEENKSPDVAIRSTTSVLQNSTVILVGDTRLSLAPAL